MTNRTLANINLNKDVKNTIENCSTDNNNSKIYLHKEICEKIHNTYIKKNHDYGDSFGKSFSKRGITAAMVRLEDKWNRLDNLTLNPDDVQVNDESISDTLLDMANYCIMTYMELEGNKNAK